MVAILFRLFDMTKMFMTPIMYCVEYIRLDLYNSTNVFINSNYP